MEPVNRPTIGRLVYREEYIRKQKPTHSLIIIIFFGGVVVVVVSVDFQIRIFSFFSSFYDIWLLVLCAYNKKPARLCDGRSGHVVAAGGFRSLLTPLSNGYMACKKSTFFFSFLNLFTFLSLRLSLRLSRSLKLFSIPLAHLLLNLHTLSFFFSTCRIYVDAASSWFTIRNARFLVLREASSSSQSLSFGSRMLSCCSRLSLAHLFLPLHNMPPSLSSSSRIIPAIHYSIKRTNTAARPQPPPPPQWKWNCVVT